MNYIPLIGLEIHVQLSTKTKLFCSCARKVNQDIYGTDVAANMTICPICLGLPGAMPYMNEEAVEKALRVGLGLNCETNSLSIWDRKNYMYPDLFTGYQISQMEQALNLTGYVEISNKKIRINRAHLENDAAKSLHVGGNTLLDANKSGVPLVEIVSEPDMRNADEAKEYAEKVQQIVRWIDASDADMFMGEMKFDINVSLCVEGDPEKDGLSGIKHTPIVEVKNRNSFKELYDVINYEIKRQTEEYEKTGVLYTKGSKVTMGWDEVKGATFLQREKEEADDYRYFHEPDVPPFVMTDEFLNRVKSTMPKPMDEVIKEIVDKYKSDVRRVSSLVGDRNLYAFFLECQKLNADYSKQYIDWIMSDINNILTTSQQDISEVNLQPKTLIDIITNVEKNILNRGTGHDILVEFIEGNLSGKSVEEIINERGLAKVSDTGFIEELVKNAIVTNPKVVEDIKSGKDSAKMFIVGVVMRESKGKADVAVVREILDRLLTA